MKMCLSDTVKIMYTRGIKHLHNIQVGIINTHA